MKNTKIIIIAAVLVLAAALVLFGCIYLIGEPDEDTKGYAPDEMTMPPVIEETPTAQSEMQKKFAAYGREERGDNGERIFRLFTEEQVKESMELRERGERRTLTYDEIIFLINDSIRMYFEYDKILVTDFMSHTHVKEPTGPLDFDMKIQMDRYKKCRVSSFEYTEIIPYHGDYSDRDSYKSALATYRKMIYDIECMIFERLRIHDTGTDSYCLVSPTNDRDYSRLYGILLDGGKITDSEKYAEVLNNSIKHAITNMDLVAPEDEHPMILVIDQYEADSGKPMLSIYYNEVGERRGTKLFPTEQLEALRPDGKITLLAKTDELIPRNISIEFDRWNKTVKYNEIDLGYETAMSGYYGLSNYIDINRDEYEMIYLSFGSGVYFYLDFDGNKVRFYEDSVHRREGIYEELTVECQSPYNEDVVFPDIFEEK